MPSLSRGTAARQPMHTGFYEVEEIDSGGVQDLMFEWETAVRELRSPGRATLISPAPRRHPVFTSLTIGQTPDCAAEKWTSYSRRPQTFSLSMGILAGENALRGILSDGHPTPYFSRLPRIRSNELLVRWNFISLIGVNNIDLRREPK